MKKKKEDKFLDDTVPAGNWQDNICIATIKYKNVAKTIDSLSLSLFTQNRIKQPNFKIKCEFFPILTVHFIRNA